MSPVLHTFPPVLAIASPSTPVASMQDLAATLQGCFRPPAHMTGSQVTVQFRLDARGALQGRPRIVSSESVVSEGDRRALDAAVLDALRRCTPLDFAPGFGASLVGRTLTFHLVGGPPPQGI